MTRSLQLPHVRDRAVELSTGGTRRVFRKKILPIGELDYDGRKLRFDKPYLMKVKQAFENRAFDAVPLQLATPSNDHNNDPELTRGLVQGLEFAEGDGLYARVAMGERGAALVDEFPELAVSVRLIEGHQGHDAALQHVLATWDPRVTRMGAWEPVDLSNTRRGPVIDLSGLSYAPLTRGRKGATVPATYTREQLDAVVKSAVEQALAGGGPAASAGETDPSDADLDAIAAEFFGDLSEDGAEDGAEGEGSEDVDFDDVDARELVEASAQHATALEMSNQRSDDLSATVLELTRERDAANFEKERDRWMQKGIPGHVVNLCRPLLEGKDKAISLSNGETVEPAALLRQAFDSLTKTGLVDLSRSIGTAHDGSDDQAAKSETDRLANQVLSNLGYATEG